MLNASRVLLAVFAALGMSSALAGYAYPAPPPGYSRVGDAWTYRAANASEWLGSTVRTNGTLNVGGRAVTIPATLRMAANAPRFAAAALFSPAGMAVAAGAAVFAPILADLWEQHNVRWNGSAWERVPSTREIRHYTNQAWGTAPFGAYPDIVSFLEATACGPGNVAYTTMVQSWGLWNAGCYIGDPLPAQPEPITEPEFVPLIEPLIPPSVIPQIVPNSPIPVEYPDINPSADPVPQPRPMRIPLGDPVPKPNPAYDPVTNPSAPPYIWERPYVVINPSPSPDSPWRVDTQPETIVAPEPSKLPDNPADPVTDGDPDTNPSTNPEPLPDVSTPTTPQEIITCGLPNTPPCKIDESGTPEAEASNLDQADQEIENFKSGLGANVQEKLDEIEHEWTWSFALPTGCSALQFDTRVGPIVEIDMCQHQPMIHDIMSMLWAAAGVFGALMIFLRANG